MRRAEGNAAERDEREPNDGRSFSTNGAMLRSVEYFEARSFLLLPNVRRIFTVPCPF